MHLPALVDSVSKFTILLAFLLLANSFNSYSQPGVLDATFGDKGKVLTSIRGEDVRISSIALQKDGKLVLLGVGYSGFFVVRYNKNGLLDSSFANNGILMGSAEYYYHTTMTLDQDNKLLISGVSQSLLKAYKFSRYNSDGSLDSSFGTGGKVVKAFEGYDSYARISQIISKNDGKILVVGVISTALKSDVALTQFNKNGTLDSSYGINGKVVMDLQVGGGLITMELYDEKVLLTCAGYSRTINGNGISTYLLKSNGSIDSSFGNNGVTIIRPRGSRTPKSLDVAVDKDRNIIILENGDEGGMISFGSLTKLKPSGNVDVTFGQSGSALIYISETGVDIVSCNTVSVMPDGKVIVTGTATFNNSAYRFFLFRFKANGTPDNTFGKHAVVLTAVSGIGDSYSSTSLLQPDGKIVLAGYNSDDAVRLAVVRYLQNPIVYYSTVRGLVYFDANKNGIRDATENFFADAQFSISKAGTDTVFIQSRNGNFVIDVDSGSYIASVKPGLPYYTVVPQTRTTSHVSYFNNDTLSFALQRVNGKRDLAVSLVPISVARPGFTAQYKIVYTNQGTDTISNGTIEFIKNGKLSFVSAAPATTTVNGDTLRWNFSNLKPLDIASIAIDLKVTPPPAVNNGNTLRFVAAIFPLNTDLTPNDNAMVLLQRVVGSYDPNDKTESHAGRLKVLQVQQGDNLQYTIRFQNTGTDTAFNVFIKDTLSNNVDWNTLKVVTASHNYQLNIQDGNKCTWAFNNINLADSNTNERLSHGYVVYSVKAKKSLVAGNVINNTAHIYFDYNLPVQTNIEQTTVEAAVLPLKLIAFTARREGKSNIVQWSTAKEINVSSFEIEKSTNGGTYASIGKTPAGLSNYSYTDLTPAKSINYYRLKIIDKDGKYEYSSVRTVNNSSSFSVSLYPNPVTEKFMVQINAEKREEMQLQIAGADGKIMTKTKLTLPTGQNIKSFSVSTLAAGTYYLTLTTEKERALIKFQKL